MDILDIIKFKIHKCHRIKENEIGTVYFNNSPITEIESINIDDVILEPSFSDTEVPRFESLGPYFRDEYSTIENLNDYASSDITTHENLSSMISSLRERIEELERFNDRNG